MIVVVINSDGTYVITIIRVCGKLFSGQGFGTSFIIHGTRVMKQKRWNNSCVFSLKIFYKHLFSREKRNSSIGAHKSKNLVIAFRL
jgi:hypothetical protein